jgi:pilus assembly protein Flp/PilA
MLPMGAIIRRFLSNRRGATAVEYGIIVAVLSLVIMAGVGTAGNALENMWLRIGTDLDATWN